jgi:hypothetical protein
MTEEPSAFARAVLEGLNDKRTPRQRREDAMNEVVKACRELCQAIRVNQHAFAEDAEVCASFDDADAAAHRLLVTALRYEERAADAK